jgi:hypothetical protein
LSSEAYFSGDDDSLPDELGPGDSHYDMAGFFEADGGNSDYELPAYRSNSGLPEEHPSGTFEPAITAVPVASPWYDGFIDTLSRIQLWIAVGFGTSSLAVLGFLLARALAGGAIIDTSITALIVGCVGTFAFMMLSISATVLIVLVVDLGRNLRQLIVRSNQRARIAGE